MSDGIIKSGIAVIGDITWGTHFCQFYQTKHDLIDTLVPYFKAGLENNEFCMWVTADNLTEQEARKAMSKAMPGFSRYLKKGQIEILPYNEWYLKGGSFNSQSVLDGWVEKLNQALAKGYSGLRLTGNTFWLEKEQWRSFTDYEEAVNSIIGKYKMIALCTYCLDKCNAAEIVDVIRNHEFALIKQEGKWELFENSRYKATKEALAESENLMHAFFDSPGAMRGIVEIVDDTTVRHIADNNVTAGFMGLTPEDLKNKLSSELGEPPEIIRIWVNNYRKSLQTGKPVHFEYQDMRGEQKVWLSVIVRYLRTNASGQPQFAYVVIDITERKDTEQKLIQQAAMLDSANDAIIGYDTAFRIIYWNNGAERVYGYSAAEALGKVGNVLLKATYAGITREKLIDQIMKDGHLEIENSRRARDGRELVVESHIIAMRDSSGKVISYVAIDRDITERKQVLEASRRQQAEIQTLFENIPAGLVLFDAISPYRVLIHNKYYQELFAEPFRSRGMAGLNIYQYAPEVEASGVAAVFDEVVRTKQPKSFLDFSYKADPAKESWFNWYMAPIIIDDKVVALVSMSLDVRERHFAEQALKESEERFRTLNETTPIGVGVSSADGVLLYVNPAYELLLGYSHTELIGKKASDLYLNSEDRRSWIDTMNDGNAVRNIETRLKRKDGTPIWVWINVSPITYEGKPAMMGTIEDITRRKKAEEEILHLASFPELNPNPIIELGENRQIMYLNPTVNRLFPDISTEGIKHPFLVGWETLTQKLKSEHTPLINREIKVGESWYAQTVTYVRDSKSYRIYGRDITARKKSEENTLREKTFSETTINSLPGIFYLFKEDGKFLRWNRNFEKVTGYSSQEFDDLTPLDLFDPEEKGKVADAIHRVFIEGKAEIEANLLLKNGRKVPYYFTGIRMLDDDVPYLIGSGIDISEREQAEELLRETSNYLNSLFDYANAPIIVWDPQFRISRFNPAFERLTGYKSNEVIGLQLDILFPEDKKAECLKQIRRTLSGERWEVVEIPILRVDGMIRIVLWNSANVYDNDGKEIIATIAQGQDITERKQAEERLRETTNYLNNLLDYANAPIIVWDPQFHITRFNHAFERLTGISADEAVGKQLDILFPEDSKAESMEHIRTTLSGERWEVVEIPILRTDGTVRIVLWNSATLLEADDKKMVATIAQGQDITERKQAEEEVKKLNEELRHRATELEASNKELEAFAYSVSHDLRAPLRSMEGFSQALLEDFSDVLNDEGKDYLKRIQSSSETMAQLIDDLLRLSRLTRVGMQLETINLSDMVNSIATKLKSAEPKRKVKFTITPGIVAQGDEKLLSVALENLLGNAWKFSGKVPETHIEFGVTEYEGKKAYFVRDNGVGFDMTYVGKMFSPFQRLHSTNEFPGTGIGLASVQRVIHRHGGQAWAEGKTGEGATFYFTLG